MQLFMDKGYVATSIDDLTKKLGISRASLYNAFGDKRGLLFATLELAENEGTQGSMSTLRKTGSVREVIREHISDLCRQRRGCFILTLGSELANADQEIRKRVKGFLDDRRLFYRELVRKGQREGEIPKAVDDEKAASTLLTVAVGVQVLVRVHRDKKIVGPAVDQAVLSLGCC